MKFIEVRVSYKPTVADVIREEIGEFMDSLGFDTDFSWYSTDLVFFKEYGEWNSNFSDYFVEVLLSINDFFSDKWIQLESVDIYDVEHTASIL